MNTWTPLSLPMVTKWPSEISKNEATAATSCLSPMQYASHRPHNVLWNHAVDTVANAGIFIRSVCQVMVSQIQMQEGTANDITSKMGVAWMTSECIMILVVQKQQSLNCPQIKLKVSNVHSATFFLVGLETRTGCFSGVTKVCYIFSYRPSW